MESVIDVVRMEVLTKASKNERNKWKYLILLALLSNYRKFWEQFSKILFKLFAKLGVLKKIITPVKKEIHPKSIVKLRFGKGEVNNKIFKEILNKHALEFDAVQLKDPNNWHVIRPKTIQLREDIHFRLEFNEMPPQTDKKKKKSDDSDEDSDDENNGKMSASDMERLNLKDYELSESRGQVFSYTLQLEELLDFLHTNYVPVEPKSIKISELVPKTISLHNMIVGRTTKFDQKTNDMFGELLEFTISKNLTNIFLEPEIRERLMSQIDRFNDPVWYAERGLPRTLGILLHGTPGCGKTSFIKSLCAYMKRRAIIVDFKLVETVSHLRKIFSGFMLDEQNNTIRFPKDSTIYVFEDFDCMSKVFMDRKLQDEEDKEKEEKEKRHEEQQQIMFNMMAMQSGAFGRAERLKKNKNKKKKKGGKPLSKGKAKIEDKSDDSDSDTDVKKGYDSGVEGIMDLDMMEQYGYGSSTSTGKWGTTYRAKEKITLADFLELLDGIVEMDGRIIIMTTNQREKMDTALVRPGRIDLDLELCPPSILLIAQIYKHMYKHINEDILKNVYGQFFDKLPNGEIATAKVINCFMYPLPEMGLQALVDCSNNDGVEIDANKAIVVPVDIPEKWTADIVWNMMNDMNAKNQIPEKKDEFVDLWTIFKDIVKVFVTMRSIGHSSPSKKLLDAASTSYDYESNFDYSEAQYIEIDFCNYNVNIREYAIKHGHSRWRLHNWELQGSHNGKVWDVLSSHVDDTSFNKLDKDDARFKVPFTNQNYRYIRILTGKSFYDGSTSRNGCCLTVKTIQLFGTAKKIE